VQIQSVGGPRVSAIGSVKIVFNQQVSGFDVSDLVLQLDGGPNLLSGGNGVTTNDGGRTYVLTNLSSLTGDPGTYTLTLNDVLPTITNTAGLEYQAGVVTTSWTVVPPPPRPTAPSNLRAQVLTNTEVRLTWSDNEDDENGFMIQRATDASLVVLGGSRPTGMRAWLGSTSGSVTDTTANDSGAIADPKSASDPPSARCAAAGASTSRAWKRPRPARAGCSKP
jgi:hypothetical protein